MMRSNFVVIYVLLMSSGACGKWKIGTITNKTKDLVLESIGYGKNTYTPVSHLTDKLRTVTPVSDPAKAIPVPFDTKVSQRSDGCCIIMARKGDIKHQISFDGYASHAIKLGRKKTQTKATAACLDKTACDYKKYSYCARAFIELLSKEDQWESIACAAHGYNLAQGQSYATFNIVLYETGGVYKVQLNPVVGSVW